MEVITVLKCTYEINEKVIANIAIPLWHMLHGIVLLAILKNNYNWYLLFEQPSSGHFHATPFVSSNLWFPSHDLLALPSPLMVTSHPD